jgi:hypothetical protein
MMEPDTEPQGGTPPYNRLHTLLRLLVIPKDCQKNRTIYCGGLQGQHYCSKSYGLPHDQDKVIEGKQYAAVAAA